MYLNRVPENTSQGREAEAGRSSIRISDFGFRGGAVWRATARRKGVGPCVAPRAGPVEFR